MSEVTIGLPARMHFLQKVNKHIAHLESKGAPSEPAPRKGFKSFLKSVSSPAQTSSVPGHHEELRITKRIKGALEDGEVVHLPKHLHDKINAHD